MKKKNKKTIKYSDSPLYVTSHTNLHFMRHKIANSYCGTNRCSVYVPFKKRLNQAFFSVENTASLERFCVKLLTIGNWNKRISVSTIKSVRVFTFSNEFMGRVILPAKNSGGFLTLRLQLLCRLILLPPACF